MASSCLKLEPRFAYSVRLVISAIRYNWSGSVMVGKRSTVSTTRTGTLNPATDTSNSSPLKWPVPRMKEVLASTGSGALDLP